MRSEQIDVLELLVECIREKEDRLADLVQGLENTVYVLQRIHSMQRI